MTEGKGKVYLIGAGPGDRKLLTVKAAECIAQAEVIIYDRLLGEGIIGLAGPEAELIDVGKEPDRHPVPQARINELLVQKARAGKMVARVKGGDPFLFGRGGEEAEFLAENGIRFEIIPGVTSAIAVPAYAGIPVTHRGYGSALHIITGHESNDDRKDGKFDYRKLGTLDGTLVFLMAVKNLIGITEELITGGKSAVTPAAVIENGTTFQQRVVTGRLDQIAQIAVGAGIKSPAVLVVGAVVNLREKLNWFSRGSLAGKRIVITRAREQAGLFAQKIAELGGEVLEIPMIAILPPAAADLLRCDRILARINEYTWLVFTSVNGVTAFWRRIRTLQIDLRTLAGIKIGAVGEATTRELWKYGLKADFTPENYTTASLLDGLTKLLGKADQVLLLRTDIAPKDLELGLTAHGITCTTLTVYRTGLDRSSEANLREAFAKGAPDYLTFASASAVRNLVTLLTKEALPRLGPSKIVCIGPVTAAAARQAGLKVAAVAGVHTINGLIAKILELEGNETNVASPAPIASE